MNGLLQLESRDLRRRAAIHYMRIEEARDYLDTFLCAFRKLTHIRQDTRYSRNRHERTETFEEILWLVDVAVRKRFHIHSLNDSLLIDLDEKLLKAIRGKHGSIAEFVSSMNNNQDLNSAPLLKNMSEEYPNALAFIRAMEARLDELTETLS